MLNDLEANCVSITCIQFQNKPLKQHMHGCIIKIIWNKVLPCDKARCVEVSCEVRVDCVVSRDDCSVVVSVVRECLWLSSGVDCVLANDDCPVVVSVVRECLWLSSGVDCVAAKDDWSVVVSVVRACLWLSSGVA